MIFAALLVLAPAPPAPAPRPIEFEAKCADGSVLKVRVIDEKVGMVTKYGTVQVPLADIKRIEFSIRVPAELETKISLALSKLNHEDSATRDAATEELKNYRHHAYKSVVKATKVSDPETSRRAIEVATFISRDTAVWPDSDVIITEDSKLVGKIIADSFKVHTAMFGEQTLRCSDIRQLSMGGGLVGMAAVPTPAPANLMAYQNQFGKEFCFSVTGVQAGSLWGSGVYTLDSNIAVAAVHAGHVPAGQSGVVYLRVVPSPPQYPGSLQNGVTSSPYGVYPSGAYEFIKR